MLCCCDISALEENGTRARCQRLHIGNSAAIRIGRLSKLLATLAGYPHALRRDACSLEARIVGIVDVYDALTERRVYKEPWPIERVVDFFREKRGTAFEPALVDLLLDNLAVFEKIRLTEDAG